MGDDVESVHDAGAGRLEVLLHAGKVGLELGAVLVDKLASPGEVATDRVHAVVAGPSAIPGAGPA